MSSPLRRTKSRFFAKDKARDPETLASVAAFTTWRLGLNTIKRMRSAQFEIEASPQYFAFLREYLIFLIQVADRFCFPRLSLPERRAFTTSMVKHLAEQLAENQSRLLGDAHDEVRHGFIDLFNTRADEYAECGFDDSKGPDFAFMRTCSHALQNVVTSPDRVWVTDQVMSIEAPEAVETLRRLIDNVVATAGSIIAPPDEEHGFETGPLPEMPQVGPSADDPMPPE